MLLAKFRKYKGGMGKKGLFELKQKLNKLPLANKEALTISIYGVLYIEKTLGFNICTFCILVHT